ncbi:hypothetical protein, partial [Planomonospora algeriensis]
MSGVSTLVQLRPSGEVQAAAPAVPSSRTAVPTATKPEEVRARSVILSPLANAVSPPASTALQRWPSTLLHSPTVSPPAGPPASDGSLPAASQRPSPPATRPTVAGPPSWPVNPVTFPSRQVVPPSGETRNSGRGTGLVVSLPTATTVGPTAAMALSTWLEPSPPPATGDANVPSAGWKSPPTRRSPVPSESLTQPHSVRPPPTAAVRTRTRTRGTTSRRPPLPRFGLERRTAEGAAAGRWRP